MPLTEGLGPETIVVGPEGWLYTGIKGGRILRFRPDGSAMAFFANTEGRANGLAFDREGNLIVADSFKGLLSIDPTGRVKVLASVLEHEGRLFIGSIAMRAIGVVALPQSQ